MAKLWLTDKAYSLWAYAIRIIYWLVAIYLSMLFSEYYDQQSWFKVGLMVISLLFVVGFLALGRYLDHLFKANKK
ncbi:hypothetical protein GCM10007916_06210 [Psychromonas marina]|uniref:Uncharacterized protein n=1 Tax=Psychromonas marina TaxID=88364 RepID=A0ABQ6DWM6_9GAMM|nr:hypothetical protein [Psychromonas marina]GLS89554.1 hypothetical protein GCM10007916_06210 [Psychromonas marina]